MRASDEQTRFTTKKQARGGVQSTSSAHGAASGRLGRDEAKGREVESIAAPAASRRSIRRSRRQGRARRLVTTPPRTERATRLSIMHDRIDAIGGSSQATGDGRMKVSCLIYMPRGGLTAQGPSRPTSTRRPTPRSSQTRSRSPARANSTRRPICRDYRRASLKMSRS
jgi:hypothetical protein